MTKKVFRIHNEGATNEDWFSSNNISSDVIEKIATNSGDGKKLPTSIPSPFARIDLVRTAYKIIGTSGNLDGLERNGIATATDNHKLISDSLDIGQILFNFDKHKADLQLIAWDKTSSLQKLLDGNSEQKHLGKTLELFLTQDRVQYNFNNFQKIYILKFKHKIIGGTSPRTLFFAAPDAVSTGIQFGQDIMLDDKLLPLYKRDKEYIKYLYSISKTVPDFNSYFPEFNQYLAKSVEKLSEYNPILFKELNEMDYKDYLDKLKNVVYNGIDSMPLEIISGVPQKQYVKDSRTIEQESDFVISNSKEVVGNKPLILPVDPFSARYTYTEDVWNINTNVPFEDSRSLENRTLPDQGDLYPYLTMNDFLADSIIKLPYAINNNKFLTVGCNNFLLPIKESFFKYFTVDDIIEKKLLEIATLAGNSVEVKLSIPIKKGLIVYKKQYSPSRQVSNTDRETKIGTIIERSFALSVFPFVTSNDTPIVYTVGLADPNSNKSTQLNVDVFNTSSIGRIAKLIETPRSAGSYITTQNIIENKFDAIALKVGDIENFIIPLWPNSSGNGGDTYEFTIDFGTTNSHIEYKIEGHGAEKSFDINETDEQIAFLLSPNSDTRNDVVRIIEKDVQDYLRQELISERFGKDETKRSPFRTILLENKDVNYNKASFVYTHANIGFDYEQQPTRPYLRSKSNLKWAVNNPDNTKRLEHFIEQLLFLCKNKVLLNNGNLANTKITWFYPVSMTTNHLKQLRRVWEERFIKVFNIDSDNLFSYPESIAPFYYYKTRAAIAVLAKPSVSVDIGGGTTDVMIYANGEPKLITSFKFAGNSIFGDGYNANIKLNGFVEKFKTRIEEILEANNLSTEKQILDNIFTQSSSSVELVNYFFSLKDNNKVCEENLDINFSKMLQEDSEFKIIFLIFYSAIVYHIAELMKIKGMETPSNILFSGTASKTLDIIDSDKKYSSLTKLFQAIFNEVHGVKNSEITIKSNPNPKELTCKGGFHIDKKLEDLKHSELVETNLGNFKDQKVQKRADVLGKYIKYEDINDDYIKGVIDNVENFYKLFFELSKTCHFRDEFGISDSSLKIFDGIKSKHLKNDILEGLELVKADSTGDEPLSETLFFYAFIGMLNRLATALSEIK